MLCLQPTSIPPQVQLHDPQDDDTLDVVSQQLGPYDVMCGRHKDAFNNIGNRRFRVTVSLSVPRYLAAHSRKDKSVVVKSIAAMVRSNGGRFLQRKHGMWVELDEAMAHDKVGHAMRDMVAKTATATTATTTAAATTTGSVSNNNVLPVLLSASAANIKASAAQSRRRGLQQVPSNIAVATITASPAPPIHEECMHEEHNPAANEEEEFPTWEEVNELEYDDNCSLSGISFFSLDCSDDLSASGDSAQEQLSQESPSQQEPPSQHTQECAAASLELNSSTSFDLDPSPRSSVNDQMLSWLICESNTLFPVGLETMNFEDVNSL